MAREGFTVVALDGSQSAVKRAGGGVVADFVNLPFKDGSFDAIIDIVSVAHNCLGDVRNIIAEMARILRPGGRVFSAIPAGEGYYEAYEGKGAIIFPDLYEVNNLFSREFKEVSVDWTMTSEDGKYTKLWFVKAKLGDK